MQGLNLFECFYNEYGKAMFAENFPGLKYAAGAVGQGSEFMGFDDDLSKDHDFMAGFCIWLTKEDEQEYGFKLSRAYSNLPKEFCGVCLEQQSNYAQKKFGVFEIGDFYSRIIGISEPQTLEEWFYIPEYALSNAVDGKVFFDNKGEFLRIRNKLKNDMPKDVKLKKLSAHLAYMAQSGQYNFSRCISHGEEAAAQLALFEFVNHAVSVIFAFNNEYAPFYKWKFRAMKSLPFFSQTADTLEFLITTPNKNEYINKKKHEIEKLCAEIACELIKQEVSSSQSDYLENHALSVNDKIQNRSLRSLHLMEYGE